MNSFPALSNTDKAPFDSFPHQVTRITCPNLPSMSFKQYSLDTIISLTSQLLIPITLAASALWFG